jgi:hypothetical protein
MGKRRSIGWDRFIGIMGPFFCLLSGFIRSQSASPCHKALIWRVLLAPLADIFETYVQTNLKSRPNITKAIHCAVDLAANPA